MTGLDIITAVELLTDSGYDNANWLVYINSGLDDLTAVAKILVTKSNIPVTLVSNGATIDVSADSDLAKAHFFLHVWFTPSGGAIKRLRRLPIGDKYSEGWKLVNGDIIIQNIAGASSGVVRVDYYKRLEHLTSTNQSPEIPEEWHNLLVLYCAYKSQLQEEELEEAIAFRKDYQELKAQFAAVRQRDVERVGA